MDQYSVLFFKDVGWFVGWPWKLLEVTAHIDPFMMAGSFSQFTLVAVTLWLSNALSQTESSNYQQSNLSFIIMKGELLPIVFYALIAQGALVMFESTFALHSQQVLGYSVF